MKIKLEDVCNYAKGQIGIQKAIHGKYPLVVTGSERKSCSSYQFDCEAVCIPLVSSTGHGHKSLNYIHYQSGKFALGTILVALVPKNKNILSAEYLREYLFTQKDDLLVPLMKGGANVTLPIGSILNLEIELPSLKKQQKIVEITRILKKQIDDINKNIELNHAQLLKFKSSLLIQAIRGNLVSQDDNYEPAETLLKKIKVEKDKLVKERKLKKGKSLSSISSDEIPFKLPKEWSWCRLGDIIEIKSSKRIYAHEYSKDGVPFYRSKEVGELSRNKEIKNELYINVSRYQEIKEKYGVPKKGDMLLTSVGSIGNSWIVDDRKFYYKDANITQFVNHSLIFMPYIQIFIKSNFFKNQVLNKVSGSVYNALTIIKINKLLFPLPPLNKQREIVEKTESLMKICDEQEKNITYAKDNINKLNQAILSEAFRGEL